jgi:ribonuclease BN (tRNA processing enzyme)
MHLTVVGCSPAWPNPGGAQSGYLVEGDGTLLLDCGAGVLAKLRLRESWPQVDSIVISHWHLDHWGDLVPWVWGSMFRLGRDPGKPKPELWLPPGGTELLGTFGERMGTPTMFWDTFQVGEYAEAEPFATEAGLTVTAKEVPHYTIQTFAFRVTNGDKTLAYSGDSAPTDILADVARGADLFLCEATLVDGDADASPRGHLSADEAIAAFKASGARRLLLTHRPDELAAPPGYELAQDGLELDL